MFVYFIKDSSSIKFIFSAPNWTNSLDYTARCAQAPCGSIKWSLHHVGAIMQSRHVEEPHGDTGWRHDEWDNLGGGNLFEPNY